MLIVERLLSLLRRRLERHGSCPRDQQLYIFKILNTMASVVGADIFTPNYSSSNLPLRSILINMFVFFWINVYNMYITYGNLVDFMYCLETILYVGICSIKLYTFIRYKTLMLKLRKFIFAFHDKFDGNKEQDELLSNAAHNIYALAVLFGFISYFAIVLIFLYSLAWSVMIEYALPFGFLIPAVAIDNPNGFALNYLFQMCESILTVAGIVSSECCFFMFLLNACLQVDMIRLELGRLGALSTSNCNDQHTGEIRSLIHTIIEHHIAHLDFTKTMCKLFELHFFIVFGCIFFQLISIVVVVVSVPDWYPGYFVFVMLTFQLFISSALGEIFDIKCDKLTKAIYDVPWYNMPAQDQKAMKLLLLASQQPVLISYGFGTVNIRAFFEIYRKTYSIGMMMISVNEPNE